MINIDAAYVEANASIDSLNLKAISQWQRLPGEGDQVTCAEKPSRQPSAFSAVEHLSKPSKPPCCDQTHWSLVDQEAKLAQ